MRLFAPLSTLSLLGWFAFTALVITGENMVLGVGTFKLSPYDIIFLAMCLVKFGRLAEPGAYSLPTGRVGIVLMFNVLAVIYLVVSAGHQPGIDPGDVFRDLRLIFYFLVVPFICYKDLDTPDAYRKIQMFIVGAGAAVACSMLVEQVMGFSVLNPVRDIRLGVWVIPFAVVSLLYFREQLRFKITTAYGLILFMMMALVFSLNRSQYLQLMASVGIAMVLGGRVSAMRRGLALFTPAFVAAIVVFSALGYTDVLVDRVFSVQDLNSDSSYGARIQEYEGQMEMFRQAPLFGHGAGYRSWVMGEDGFELSTFAHNSWAFYLMKFGLVGTTIIMLPCLLILLFALARPLRDPRLELHRRYLIACVPVYIFIDSLSAGLAYAPKTAFTGMLLCYALSLVRNDNVWVTNQAAQRPQAAPAAVPASRRYRPLARPAPAVKAIPHG